MSDHVIDELARRQILGITEQTLREAGVLGVLPTPLEAVASAARITEIIDLSQLPRDLAKQKPRVLRRILGALLQRERLAFVDYGQSPNRARLTEAHEIAHKILPWHEAPLQLDDDQRLFGDTLDRLELEAYLAGAHILFQGKHFQRQAMDYRVSIETPIGLADEYQASLHATIRYYVTHHPLPVALLIAGRYEARDGSVPLWRSVESPAFLKEFGCLAQRLPGRIQVAGTGGALADIAHRSLRTNDVSVKNLALPDLQGVPHEFLVEAFYNTHNLLIMFSEAKAGERIARSFRLVAS